MIPNNYLLFSLRKISSNFQSKNRNVHDQVLDTELKILQLVDVFFLQDKKNYLKK